MKSRHDLPDELLLKIVTSMVHDKRDLDSLLAASPRIEVLAQTNDCSLVKTIVKQYFSIAAMLYPPMAPAISYLEEWILKLAQKARTVEEMLDFAKASYSQVQNDFLVTIIPERLLVGIPARSKTTHRAHGIVPLIEVYFT